MYPLQHILASLHRVHHLHVHVGVLYRVEL